MSKALNQKTAYELDFAREMLVLQFNEKIHEWMEEKGVDRAELARRLGKSRAHVTQLFRGNHNMTMKSLADIFLALDVEVELRKKSCLRLASNQCFDYTPEPTGTAATMNVAWPTCIQLNTEGTAA